MTWPKTKNDPDNQASPALPNELQTSKIKRSAQAAPLVTAAPPRCGWKWNQPLGERGGARRLGPERAAVAADGEEAGWPAAALTVRAGSRRP